ncbi:type IV pilin N-terminal domain-containing protein [Halobacterium sp. KA-4]|uniref:type IV pilin n=1 Tax=Halobacterium sp. KA-4 TaxID=2896367 RepID=UPI001E3937AD|nr:type IV pilin N-terminal domain-containing protein [Halobacterium sp. KA-4]MCD2201610.1 type IV pilin N-terminal domain-containing protein [Halobacterium sp. KA-4]
MRDQITLFDIPDRDDRGVSPVIGVILMVAITVILAAVIASFVLGFGSNVSENVQAGVDIQSTQSDNGQVKVTWISEGTAETLYVNTTHNGSVTANETLNSVGDTATIAESDIIEDSSDSTEDNTVTVTVIGEGESGTRTVVATKDVTI